MNDTDARRRNHWVSHVARHAHEKPGAVYLRFEGGSVTWAQLHERVSGFGGMGRWCCCDLNGCWVGRGFQRVPDVRGEGARALIYRGQWPLHPKRDLVR
jgi:hypothetical protein